jgi:hypothetical protein
MIDHGVAARSVWPKAWSFVAHSDTPVNGRRKNAGRSEIMTIECEERPMRLYTDLLAAAALHQPADHTSSCTPRGLLAQMGQIAAALFCRKRCAAIWMP